MAAPVPGQVANTILVLSYDGVGEAPGVNPYSARALHQTLDLIDAARSMNGGTGILRRTVNGELVDVSAHQMRKYHSEITGNDQGAPALDNLWAGVVLQVSCAAELAYVTATETAARPIVPGSQRVEGDYTYYRPLLTMMVSDRTVDRDEWGAVTSWKLALDEV